MPDTSDTSATRAPVSSNTSATRVTWMQRECDTSDMSETRATQVRHEHYTKDTSATRVLHEWYECDTSNKFWFCNDTSKNIFTPLYLLLYGKWKTKERNNFILYFNLFVFPGLVTLSIIHTKKLHCWRNITS